MEEYIHCGQPMRRRVRKPDGRVYYQCRTCEHRVETDESEIPAPFYNSREAYNEQAEQARRTLINQENQKEEE